MEKKQFKLSYILIAALSVLLTLAVVVTALLAFAGGFDNLKRGAKLTQILHIVQDEFVTETDLDAATDLAAAGIIQSLEDKWSYYMTADEYSKRLCRRQIITGA